MSLLKLTCREAARLLVERRSRATGLGERLSLRLHLGICSMCRRYDQQLGLMDQALGRWRAYRDEDPTEGEDPPAR